MKSFNSLVKLLLYSFCINLLWLPLVFAADLSVRPSYAGSSLASLEQHTKLMATASAYGLGDEGAQVAFASISNAAECCTLCVDEDAAQEHAGGSHFCGSCCHHHQHAFLSNASFTTSLISNGTGLPETISVVSVFPENFRRPPKASLI